MASKNKNIMTHSLKNVFFFLLITLAPAGITKAQTSKFAPLGAEWYYDYQEIMNQGYVKITVVSDTIIDGHVCQKLQKTRFGYGYYSGLYTHIIGYEYITQINDSIMIYRDGFHKLFDFGAEVGDAWIVLGQNGLCEEDFGRVRVVGKGIETYNGLDLIYIQLVDETSSYWGFSPTLFGEPSDTIKVVEQIGPIGSYLLPEQKCLFDYAEGGPLRCYSDDELGELHLAGLHPERNCDYINETYQIVSEQNILDKVSVSPNPCKNKINVRFDVANLDNCEITIFNVLGMMVYHGSFDRIASEITMDGHPSGLYCLTIKCGCRVYSKTFIKN